MAAVLRQERETGSRGPGVATRTIGGSRSLTLIGIIPHEIFGYVRLDLNPDLMQEKHSILIGLQLFETAPALFVSWIGRGRTSTSQRAATRISQASHTIHGADQRPRLV